MRAAICFTTKYFEKRLSRSPTFFLSLPKPNAKRLQTFSIMQTSSPFDRITRQGLTYDDVLLVPGYSETLPRNANTSIDLTSDLTLNVPVISAAMDTVSEYRMALALAR